MSKARSLTWDTIYSDNGQEEILAWRDEEIGRILRKNQKFIAELWSPGGEMIFVKEFKTLEDAKGYMESWIYYNVDLTADENLEKFLQRIQNNHGRHDNG